MTDEEKKRWKEIGVGAVVAAVAFVIAWKILSRTFLFGGGDEVVMFGESGPAGAAGGSFLIALLTFLAFVGRHVLDWWERRQSEMKAVALVAEPSETDAVRGTCDAIVAHCRDGDIEAATAALQSLYALVGPDPPVVTPAVVPAKATARKVVKP